MLIGAGPVWLGSNQSIRHGSANHATTYGMSYQLTRVYCTIPLYQYQNSMQNKVYTKCLCAKQIPISSILILLVQGPKLRWQTLLQP